MGLLGVCPATVTKTPEKAHKEELILVHSSRVQTIIIGKSWQQELEVAAHQLFRWEAEGLCLPSACCRLFIQSRTHGPDMTISHYPDLDKPSQMCPEIFLLLLSLFPGVDKVNPHNGNHWKLDPWAGETQWCQLTWTPWRLATQALCIAELDWPTAPGSSLLGSDTIPQGGATVLKLFPVDDGTQARR